MKYKLVLVGSTQHTLIAASQLLKRPEFEVLFVVTPTPKIRGRKKELQSNPVHLWAREHNLPVVLIKESINDQEQATVQTLIQNLGQPDFLLVVDFGYKLPNWFISLPRLYSINIHPSDLPRWRGSSPGQFVLLNGEKDSAVSVITMSSKFDQGAIVAKIPLKVEDAWTQTEYYHQAFSDIASKLPEVLLQLANKEIAPEEQPSKSPTPTARRLTKDDAFVEWSEIVSAMEGKDPKKALYIERASRAFRPWPVLWTKLTTAKGQKRMKILETKVEVNNKRDSGDVSVSNRLKLVKVQIEGQQPALWNQVKNQVQN